tara:strand:- start:14882 stop:15115 length:234 start_codon:yes stop_codon:yes gene_type:complete
MKVELSFSDLDSIIASMSAVQINGKDSVKFGKLLGRFLALKEKQLKLIETTPFDKLPPELQHIAVAQQQAHQGGNGI